MFLLSFIGISSGAPFAEKFSLGSVSEAVVSDAGVVEAVTLVSGATMGSFAGTCCSVTTKDCCNTLGIRCHGSCSQLFDNDGGGC